MLDFKPNEINSGVTAALPLFLDNEDELTKMVYCKYQHQIYAVIIKYLKSDLIAEEMVLSLFKRFLICYFGDESQASIELWLFSEVKKEILVKLKELAKMKLL